MIFELVLIILLYFFIQHMFRAWTAFFTTCKFVQGNTGLFEKIAFVSTFHNYCRKNFFVNNIFLSNWNFWISWNRLLKVFSLFPQILRTKEIVVKKLFGCSRIFSTKYVDSNFKRRCNFHCKDNIITWKAYIDVFFVCIL